MAGRNKQQGTEVVSVDFLSQGLLTPDEVAALLRVDERTLSNWRYRGIGPIFSKVGGLVRYTRSDVNSFVSHSRQAMTGHALVA